MSLNPFLDLGFPREEATALHIRAQLAAALEHHIERKGWSQTAAARALKVPQTTISKIAAENIDCDRDRPRNPGLGQRRLRRDMAAGTKGVPGREALAYLCAVVSLGSGIGLLWQRAAANEPCYVLARSR